MTSETAIPLTQHQDEILQNRVAWERKPLLRELYRVFYERIAAEIDRSLPGRILELGSGIGNLKQMMGEAIASDLFPNPWLDLVCDGYELPLRDRSLSHLILFDVFHHLQAPNAFFREAHRVLAPQGRVIIFDPYISLISSIAYGIFHHEPIAWRQPIDFASEFPAPRPYYAAQGNATRLFFRRGSSVPDERWHVVSRRVFADFSYLLSGGFSKPALYPAGWLPTLTRVDNWLHRLPMIFGARALVTLARGS